MPNIIKKCRFCENEFEAASGSHAHCSRRCHILGSCDRKGPCWNWTAGKDKDGYGIVVFSGRSRVKAHRASYELFVGAIPEGLMVRHSCNNPACVNPEHLSTGTAKDNTQDCVRSGRNVRGERVYWKAKLTERDVLDIRKSDAKSAALAESYNVSPVTVQMIRRRATWKHI